MDLSRHKNSMILASAAASLLVAAVGVVCAMRSPIFTVRVVEVADLPERAPVDSAALESLASIPVGKKSLFSLELGPIERRLLSNEWVKEVFLRKRFPQTLVMSVKFREPKALHQSNEGMISYVDADGKVFGKVNLKLELDLPLLSGFSGKTESRLPEALKLVDAWNHSAMSGSAPLSQLSWDGERGFRGVVTYPLKNNRKALGRALIEFGQEFDGDFSAQIGRLERVFSYLSENSVPTKQVWAGSGKKIVVKTARGS